MNKFKFKAGDNVEINTFGHCPGWDGKSGIIVESDCNSRNPRLVWTYPVISGTFTRRN